MTKRKLMLFVWQVDVLHRKVGLSNAGDTICVGDRLTCAYITDCYTDVNGIFHSDEREGSRQTVDLGVKGITYFGRPVRCLYRGTEGDFSVDGFGLELLVGKRVVEGVGTTEIA